MNKTMFEVEKNRIETKEDKVKPFLSYNVKQVEARQYNKDLDENLFYVEDDGYLLTLGKTVFYTEKEAVEKVASLLDEIKTTVDLEVMNWNLIQEKFND